METMWTVRFQANDDYGKDISFGVIGKLFFKSSDNFDEAVEAAKQKLSNIGFDHFCITSIKQSG